MMRSTSRPNIVVIGSANIDLVATAATIPAPGQTVIGDGFRIVHGGKGANQAVAVARLGESVAMIGCVGDDDFGRSLRSGLSDACVNCSHLRTLKGLATADQSHATGAFVDHRRFDRLSQIAGTAGCSSRVNQTTASHVTIGDLVAAQIDRVIGR